MLDLELVERYDIWYGDGRYHRFIEDNRNIYTERLIGDCFVFGDLILEILAVKNPEITTNLLNNSSVVIRVQANDVSVLFLGDLGREGGRN